jgi:hypothetical protein
MQFGRSWLLGICALLVVSPAIAGPYKEFEAQLRSVYAPYRSALFHTNKKDKALSEQAIGRFASDWARLTARWSTEPPPQYEDDLNFAAALGEVTTTIQNARGQISKGELAQAHEVLEKIRDVLGDLRGRNGIITFSDRMNGYHEAMEHILTKSYGGFDAKGIGELREDASVLSYLFGLLQKYPPGGLRDHPDFTQAVSSVKRSVEELLGAVRAADATAARQAIQNLKQPYAVLFLKFG